MPTTEPLVIAGEGVSLHRLTVALLENRPRKLTLQAIATKTNVTLHWLERLARNEIKEPGVNKIERVYRFLMTYKPEV